MKLIAVNSKHTGDRKKDNRGYAGTWTSGQLDKLLAEPWLAEMVAEIRAGDEKKKDSLPYICPHYTEFRNNHRAQADIVPESFTFMTCVDVDDLSLVDKAIKTARRLNRDKYSEWYRQVLRIEYSARKKVHIYIRIPKGMTIEEAQKAFCADMNIPYDESCVTPERFIYITGKAEEIYRSKEWLKPLSEEEIAERREAYLLRGLDVDGRALKKVDSSKLIVDSQLNKSKVGSPTSDLSPLTSVSWHGYDIQTIIDKRYAEKLPCSEDKNRHNESLKLASDLLIMLDGDKKAVQQIVESQSWVQEIIKERGEKVAQTVDSAAERMTEREKRYLSQMPSKAMQEAIKEATGKTYREITQGIKASVVTDADEIQQWLWQWGAEIEKMMSHYPLLHDITKGLKPNQYPAAVFVAGGLMMTLMTRCTYRFYHRPEELRRLNNCTLIIGDPASGKSFATRLFKLIAAPMVAADKAGIAAINHYKEQMKTKGANKEKPQKPRVLFRVHPARTSNAQFIQDMVNAVETVDGEDMQLHMLTFDTELDNTLTIQKGGSWIDKQSMELKAFHNEEDGQAYSNLDSVVQNFNVTWNFIYTGTPLALKKKVNQQNFGSGLATRLTVIPLPSTDFEMLTRETIIDHQSDVNLKEWAFKLDRMKGELSVQRLVDELYDWTARRMMDAKENESKADEMLLKRCAYHGLNFAAPFIVMRHWSCIHQEGSYWCGEFETDEIDWQLVELLVNIQYACQRYYFGAMAEAYFDSKDKDVSANAKRNKKTLDGFNRLPEEFTSDDVMRCFGLTSDSAVYMRIARLQKDHLIEKAGDYTENGHSKSRYCKTGRIMQ